MPVTYTPDPTSDDVQSWVPVAYDDPYAYVAHDNKVVPGKELADHQAVTAYLLNVRLASLLGQANVGLMDGLGDGLPALPLPLDVAEPKILMSPVVNLLVAGDYLLKLPAGKRFFVESCQVIVTTLAGVVNAQPFIRVGIDGTVAKYLAAVQTTLLTAVGKRDVYQTLLQDDGENVSMSVGVSTAATLTSGSVYKGRFLLKGMLVCNG